MSVLADLRLPIVLAPMAGGPSTPALAAAVSEAGGLGFLAAGYLTPERFSADFAATAALTMEPFGVNVFVPGPATADPAAIAAYAERLQAEADRLGVALGDPVHDDDWFDEKIDLVLQAPPAVVSFTFGLPPVDVVQRLAAAGVEVWCTVTGPADALLAAARGADVLVLQGVEAGGHRATFDDADPHPDDSLLVALQRVRAVTDLPLVATGALTTGPAIAAVLAAGAAAAQVGTAYLLADEAGTANVLRAAVQSDGRTVLTRAFSGRTARGVTNRLHADHAAAAPAAYPEVHHLTTPLRAAGRSVGDAGVVNLWAGQAHELAVPGPAAEITRRLATDAVEALAAATARWPPPDAPAVPVAHPALRWQSDRAGPICVDRVSPLPQRAVPAERSAARRRDALCAGLATGRPDISLAGCR